MNKIYFFCVCKEKYEFFSSYNKNVNINICKNCHFYYTKKKKTFESSKRINNFNEKYKLFFKK